MKIIYAMLVLLGLCACGGGGGSGSNNSDNNNNNTGTEPIARSPDNPYVRLDAIEIQGQTNQAARVRVQAVSGIQQASSSETDAADQDFALRFGLDGTDFISPDLNDSQVYQFDIQALDSEGAYQTESLWVTIE